MIRATAAIVVGALALSLPSASLADIRSPYADLDGRSIASLSEADVAALLAGSGWGLALPAELNGVPGPLHVLELSDALALSEMQEAQIEAIPAAMLSSAKALGAQYVELERELSVGFQDGTMTPDRLRHLTRQAGETMAELREAHLLAHLKTSPILTKHQLHQYQVLRGYDADTPYQHGNQGHRHQVFLRWDRDRRSRGG